LGKPPTLLDRVHGRPPDGAAFARLLSNDTTNRLLSIVSEACDLVVAEICTKITDWDENFDDLERQLTELLAARIERVLGESGGFLPLGFRHGPYEREGRSPAPAQPREYDLGFYWNADERLIWPIEAKVLKDDSNTVRNLGDYVGTIQKRYLSCTYAPFSPSGVMLAYLKRGEPEVVFRHIGTRLRAKLSVHHSISLARPHRLSDHVRSVPPGSGYVASFSCHHLVLQLDVHSGPTPSSAP
jgi:hypothetical protein